MEVASTSYKDDMKTNKKPNSGRKERDHHKNMEDSSTSQKDDMKTSERPNHGRKESARQENVEFASTYQEGNMCPATTSHKDAEVPSVSE